jgi:hypothetical protein
MEPEPETTNLRLIVVASIRVEEGVVGLETTHKSESLQDRVVGVLIEGRVAPEPVEELCDAIALRPGFGIVFAYGVWGFRGCRTRHAHEKRRKPGCNDRPRPNATIRHPRLRGG